MVEFILTGAEPGYYSYEGIYVVEPGEFEVMVGTYSQKVLKVNFIKNKIYQ